MGKLGGKKKMVGGLSPRKNSTVLQELKGSTSLLDENARDVLLCHKRKWGYK